MKVHNTTQGDLGLGSGFIVRAGGSLEIEEEQMEKLLNSKVVRAWANAGWILPDGELMQVKADRAVPGPEAIKRYLAVVDAIKALDPETGFTQSGKPEVDAVNKALPEGMEPIDAAERDAVWATIPQE
ncbi:MAG: hypothetical protein AB3N24_17695 [Leisingera sp.]